MKKNEKPWFREQPFGYHFGYRKKLNPVFLDLPIFFQRRGNGGTF